MNALGLWSGAMLGVLGTFAGGCAALGFREQAPEQPTPAAALVGQRAQAPDIPFALAQPDDYVVRVVAGSVTCSGTLIDEQLVLTAHHCVAERDTYGDIQSSDVRPDEVLVELGGDDLPWGEVGVDAIVAPECGWAAGVGDIAVLVLERRLIGIATAVPRLDVPPIAGEQVDPVGFGRCALSHGGIRRHERSGGRIDATSSHRFNLSASICPGDSGGPALDERGRVVGVISASVMDGSDSTRGRSEFTRLDAFRAIFANAQAIAAGASPAELPPVDVCPAR